MSKRAAERLSLELAAFIRGDFSDILFLIFFFPISPHPSLPPVLPFAAGKKYPKTGIHEIYSRGLVLS